MWIFILSIMNILFLIFPLSLSFETLMDFMFRMVSWQLMMRKLDDFSSTLQFKCFFVLAVVNDIAGSSKRFCFDNYFSNWNIYFLVYAQMSTDSAGVLFLFDLILLDIAILGLKQKYWFTADNVIKFGRFLNYTVAQLWMWWLDWI